MRRRSKAPFECLRGIDIDGDHTLVSLVGYKAAIICTASTSQHGSVGIEWPTTRSGAACFYLHYPIRWINLTSGYRELCL